MFLFLFSRLIGTFNLKTFEPRADGHLFLKKLIFNGTHKDEGNFLKILVIAGDVRSSTNSRTVFWLPADYRASSVSTVHRIMAKCKVESSKSERAGARKESAWRSLC